MVEQAKFLLNNYYNIYFIMCMLVDNHLVRKVILDKGG